jgi:hypothetical protein
VAGRIRSNENSNEKSNSNEIEREKAEEYFVH